jgi:hypothetical protein
MEERRGEPRRELKIPVRITFYKESETREVLARIECRTKDISISGLRIRMKVRSAEILEKLNNFTPDQNNAFFIEVGIVRPEKELCFSGDIMWSNIIDFENNEIQIGMRITNIDVKTHKEWAHIVEKSKE